MAVVDYFLKIEGIPGESADAKHKGEIDVEAWSWGETHPSPLGAGGGAGKVQVHDLQVTANVSKASPELMLACASGQHFTSAVLTGRRGGQAQTEFLVVSLSDVLVSAYQTGGSEAGPPVDTFSLKFSKIQIEHRQLRPDGSLGASTKAGWDVQQNKKL